MATRKSKGALQLIRGKEVPFEAWVRCCELALLKYGGCPEVFDALSDAVLVYIVSGSEARRAVAEEVLEMDVLLRSGKRVKR